MTQAVSPAEHKQKLLKDLDESFNELLKAIEGLSEDQMKQVWYGTWGVREILVHCAAWNRERIGAFARVAQGVRPTPEGVDYNDTDSWNSRFVEEKGDVSPQQALDELKAVYDVYRAAAAALPDARYEPGRIIDRLLHANAIDHYREHAEAIREWRQKAGL